MSALLTKLHDDGRLEITLNRPEIHNAFDDQLIAQLDAALAGAEQNPLVRVLVLRAAGRSFSAGADLAWMGRMAAASAEQNYADALAFARMMERLDRFPHPVVAVVQGAAFGGGVGLIAACDIAIGSTAAEFALSEVRLGLIPAVISPYVIRAIGERASRRFFLTAEKFGAAEATRIGLLHQLVAPDELEPALLRVLGDLASGGPQAHAAAKSLLHDLREATIEVDFAALTAGRIAAIRTAAEGQEGMRAFLEKRKPRWRRDA